MEEASWLSTERSKVKRERERRSGRTKRRGEQKGVANSCLACKFRRHPSGSLPFARLTVVGGSGSSRIQRQQSEKQFSRLPAPTERQKETATPPMGNKRESSGFVTPGPRNSCDLHARGCALRGFAREHGQSPLPFHFIYLCFRLDDVRLTPMEFTYFEFGKSTRFSYFSQLISCRQL